MRDSIISKIRTLKGRPRLTVADSAAAPCKLWSKGPSLLFCTHVGTSMNPTLCGLDLLEIEPYGNRSVRVGDVILFLPPEGIQSVVHRVMGMTPQGIRTRGDNNPSKDPWFLLPADIAGRVIFAWRGQRKLKIAGGQVGCLVAHLARWRRVLGRGVYPLLRPFYLSLARFGIVRRLLPTCLRPRVVIFHGAAQGHLQLLLGRRVVGRYNACQRQWHIQRFFRLFVDEAALPENPDGKSLQK